MWFVWLLIGLIGFIAFTIFMGDRLCPSCGVELPTKFAAPWEVADHCPGCGWSR